MIQTVKAVIDSDDRIRLLEPVQLTGPRRALLTIFDESNLTNEETALLSEAALAVDWNRPEEDAAWVQLR